MTTSEAPESRRDRFVRLANKRVNKALKAMRLIGNLSNRSSYEYTDADINKIIRTLDAELKELRLRFETGARSDDEFSL